MAHKSVVLMLDLSLHLKHMLQSLKKKINKHKASGNSCQGARLLYTYASPNIIPKQAQTMRLTSIC